ncbi:MAG: peptidylprolyl isomerase [Acidimicrobiales bacterium]
MKHLGILYRLAVGIGVVLGASSLLSACNASPAAATVDGHIITSASLDSYLSQVSGSSYAQCELDLRLGGTLPVHGTGHATVSPDLSAEILTSLIEQRVVSDYLTAHKIKVTGSDVSIARSDLGAELTSTSSSTSAGAPSGSPCGISGIRLIRAVPVGFAGEQVALQADIETFMQEAGHFSASASTAHAYYNQHPQNFANLCLNALVATSQAEGVALRQQIAKGASFASLAKTHASSPSSAASGGSIGCVPVSNVPSQIASAIGTLPVGGVSQPLEQASTGAAPVWFILQVASRRETPFAQVEGSIRMNILASHTQALTSILPGVLKRAKVSVSSMYGTWSSSHGVVPPTSPPSRFVKG